MCYSETNDIITWKHNNVNKKNKENKKDKKVIAGSKKRKEPKEKNK